ncbi:PREDICTED: F-box/kelch-repeat protein At3g06240-like isoform X3 [Erythranthe guttata]|uniref:F-box/kelch-repeat protein At3g06240-like isoform X3 n=1 Tax=Erythranthe guttata TaxID=4155 RepID=UPI00064DFB01|nr:PREDICTED: F-box/kelch-repeat protein At3g06240-like isoform X3 [Erythranthe guttata]|eukprot:XP_012853138.1 PREDICTED: F-box/kelch-repeat protein At3g06240-like isoform X3 [Erythranthe guttata]
MDTTDLPFHIIMVILSMLPVEALAKFQCVCKAWKNIIRDPKFVKDHFQIQAAKGFGYYEHTNDYLIIRIAILSDEEDEATSKVEVYSMVANSWKNLEVDRFPWERIELKSEAVMRDSVHWKADYRDGDEGIPVILAYRMGEEVFRQIGLPNYKADGKGLVEHIGVYKGNLAMFVFHQSDHFSWHKNCHLWVMNEYGVVSSWTKLYTVVIDAGVVTPIMFTNNDEIIFEDGECDLTVCHFERNTISYLGVEDQGYLNFVTYNGSLVMLED